MKDFVTNRLKTGGIGVCGLLMFLPAVGAVIALGFLSNWFYNSADIWILGAITRVIGGLMGLTLTVGLLMFVSVMVWGLIKGNVE